MGGFKEYDAYDGLGLADLVKRKEVSAGELLEEAIARTEALNPKLNAVVFKHYEEAKKLIEKGLPEGPFKGVPFLLKDLHLLWEGTETAFGSAAWRGNIADHNSTLTDRYLDAGLVIFGKTNSPELGLTGTTEPRAFGATRNPWNLERSPGGSSGGAASAVAAGILPVANASDGGGSIRIPAATCGLFGMKPTRARTPMGPDRGEGWGGMSISHVVSRSVRDSAAMLDATGGPADGDPYAAPAQERPFLEEVSQTPGILKIAFNTKRPDGSDAEPEVVEAIKRTAILCESLGHVVEEAAPKLDPQAMSAHQGALIGANVALALKQRGEALGRDLGANDVEHITWLIAEAAKARSAVDYAEASLFIHKMGRMMGTFHAQYDVYLCPVIGAPHIPLGVLDMMREDVGGYMDAIRHYMPFTALFNMTGQPSMSVPLFWSQDGMPIGSMFTGRFGDEATLFRLAGQLEEAQPWKDRRPAV
ncbi:amidase [Tepidicaulis sp. LMO-SS28]|uniref:amidase n=1 Tax=Tepidicaulis sp. LMO-SS28 TaxID=3447455 RepID=UPI003EE40686